MNKQSIIKSILDKGDSLNSREIYDTMEPDEKGFFGGGVDAVGKFLYAMRDKGLIENGISDIVNGRTVLTWKIKNAPLLQKAEANKEPSDIQDAAQPKIEDTIQQATIYEPETKLNDIDAMEFNDMINSFGSGVNAFIAGTRKLIAELDEAKAEIERLKASQAIANKRETIAVLKHVQGFVKPINEDFDVVLGDIVQKIEAMPEAA